MRSEAGEKTAGGGQKHDKKVSAAAARQAIDEPCAADPAETEQDAAKELSAEFAVRPMIFDHRVGFLLRPHRSLFLSLSIEQPLSGDQPSTIVHPNLNIPRGKIRGNAILTIAKSLNAKLEFVGNGGRRLLQTRRIG